VCSRAQDRQWACKVKQVKLVLERNEHVNGLLVIDRGGLVCSHLERRQWGLLEDQCDTAVVAVVVVKKNGKMRMEWWWWWV
jgi:hypothetical protein